MLEYCNVGVAVNSGGDEIKAMADYVTDDVAKDGIYKAFVHFGLIDDVKSLLKVFAQAKAFLFDIFSLIEICLC